MLVPGILSLVDPTAGSDTVIDDWQLDRWSGPPIDDSMTLAENGVRDGELVILASRDAAPPAPVQWDPCRTVAVADPPTGNARAVGPAVCAWAAIAASGALGWGGAGAQGWSHLIVAAAGSAAAAIMAIANGSGTVLRVAAVCLAAAAGFLAVPSTPCAASAFLAASAGFSMALLMMRSATSVTLVAMATLSGLAALAALPPLIGTVSLSAVGATLATASLALLAVAPRTAILASGLRPDDHPDDCDARPAFAHAILTGMVIGCASGTAIGALVVAVGCRLPGSPILAGVSFTLVVGAALSLRLRSHVDGPRRTALLSGGLCCFTAGFVIATAADPASAGWTSAVVIAIGLGAVRDREVGPGVVRAVELLEYAVLAAVLPLACWVGGVYAFARESHLL
jgi:type VII secretion integral membrane protein EccD